ncbi:hypothetical protein [uncultured Shimia sp.]|uniref:hypothetical protein n=1 Tax=uncultured Shimia sp. TaxID=573152 RepID=UPI00261E8178|nr:hypothetical protein [uncultured Shimia sp.]
MVFDHLSDVRAKSVGWLALIGICFGTVAMPCAFHGYAPKPTLVERLIWADNVVLARPSETTPFSFTITDQLRGEAFAGTLPFLVDSTTRRLLRVKPQARVLFAREPETEEWHRLITVDKAIEPLVQGIWEALPDWQNDPGARATFFADLLHHADRRARELALRELDLADYATLQALDFEVDANSLRAQLDVTSQMDLRAIRILLLGFSEWTQELSGFLKSRVTQGVAHESDMLGAYVLSLVELDGERGLRWLAESHLSGSNHTYSTHSALVQALAMHFQAGDADLRKAIEDVLTARVLFDPELAYVVSLQFSAIAANAGLDVPESGLDEDPSLEALKAMEISRLIPVQG